MIQINLLDQSQARSRGRRAAGGRSGSGGAFGSVVLAIVAAGMVGLNGYAGWTCYSEIHAAAETEKSARTKLKTIEDQIEKTKESSEQIRKFEEVVNNQKEVLKTLDPPDRLLWCEKINLLANLIPAKVFLSKVEVTEVVEMVETEASKAAHAKWEQTPQEKRGKEPEVVKRPIVHYDIALTGLATGRDNTEQMSNVMDFHKALIGYQWKGEDGKDHRFMDGFVDNVDFGPIEATAYEGVNVQQFVFKLRTHNQGGVEEKPATPATQVADAASPGAQRREKVEEVLNQ